MKKIPISGGQFSDVDDEDFRIVSRHTWSLSKGRNTDYAVTCIGGKNVRMHKLIMSTPSGMVVDHINRNGLDNRRGNLRICTVLENARNHKILSTNKSGVNGVHWASKIGKWCAQITVSHKKKHLGYFKEITDAISSRKKAEDMLFGEFSSQT